MIQTTIPRHHMLDAVAHPMGGVYILLHEIGYGPSPQSNVIVLGPQEALQLAEKIKNALGANS